MGSILTTHFSSNIKTQYSRTKSKRSDLISSESIKGGTTTEFHKRLTVLNTRDRENHQEISITTEDLLSGGNTVNNRARCLAGDLENYNSHHRGMK